MRTASLLLFLSGCIVLEDTSADPDLDGDGFKASEDCDDEHAEANPDGVERCDDHNIDEDCDGLVNDQDPDVLGGSTYFADLDDDGYGDLDTTVVACDIDDGLSGEAGDCDDTNEEIHPSAQEVCDGADVDEDCDQLVDDEDPDVLTDGYSVWYPDDDGDGFGTDTRELTACDAPDGWVTNVLDCDDHDGDRNPDAVEMCDDVDNDCDGWADGDDSADAGTWYADADDDTYGDESALRVSCDQPEGFVARSGDCDDDRPLVRPGGTETCNGRDDDCDGDTDETGTDASTWYADGDGDGYGDSGSTRDACDAPSGYVDNDDDCDDSNASVSPGATEVCDAADEDEDCDGYADDADDSTSSTGKTTLYYDGDGDTYGDSSVTMSRCDTDTDWSTTGGDCDDDDSGANPGETEVCDSGSTDEDCDGYADDNDSSVSAGTRTTWYIDADGDGYGVSTTTQSKCDQPSGYSQYSTDCDDTNALRDPGNTEVCDASDVDEDCDGSADDADSSATGKISYFVDADADGYGDDSAIGTSRCNAPSGYAAGNTDCDDADAGVNPAAIDVCFDTEDTDCDGSAECVVTHADAGRVFTGVTSSDYAGKALAAVGDVDNDGYDDLVVGALYEDAGGTSAGRAYLVKGGASTADIALSAADAIYTGEDTYDYAGTCIAGLGDFDGDGKDDFAIGATGDDDGASGAGAVYIIKGPGASVDLSAANYKLRGPTASYAVGVACAGAGDVNGTGKGSLIASSTYAGSYKGTVYLVTTAASGASAISSASAVISGESTSDYFGIALDGAGDVNADGYDDFIVGANGDDDVGTDAGAVYVFLGPVSGTIAASAAEGKLRGPSSSDDFGYWVGGGGDHNDDGYDDIVGVAPDYASGSTYVINGPYTGTSTVTSVADATLSGVQVTSMDLGGDIDADGTEDLLLSAGYGTVYGFFGPLSGTLSTSTAGLTATGTSYFGNVVRFAGDHDGDGADDFVVSDYYGGTSSGGAGYVFFNSEL